MDTPTRTNTHPHIHTPTCTTDKRLLHGGGSSSADSTLREDQEAGEAEFLHCVLSYEQWQTLWRRRGGRRERRREDRRREEGGGKGGGKGEGGEREEVNVCVCTVIKW